MSGTLEPFYIRQCADHKSLEERKRWFEDCAAEAKAEGAKHARFTIHPAIDNLLLVEAWREYPKGDAGKLDEGEPRFFLTVDGGS